MTQTNTRALYGVVQREGMTKAMWTRIGTAFENRDSSWNLRFDYVPRDPAVTVQMRPLPDDDPPKDEAP